MRENQETKEKRRRQDRAQKEGGEKRKNEGTVKAEIPGRFPRTETDLFPQQSAGATNNNNNNVL